MAEARLPCRKMNMKKRLRFAKVAYTVLIDRNLNPIDKIVYCVLDSFANGKTGANCFPSYKAIAQRLNKSNSTVKRSLKKLKEGGYITWTPGYTGMANLYTLVATYGSKDDLIGNDFEPGIGSPLTRQQQPITTISEQFGAQSAPAEKFNSSLSNREIMIRAREETIASNQLKNDDTKLF